MKKLKRISPFILTGCACLSTPTFAFDPFVEFGLYAGGDQIAHATYTNGDTDSIDAGGLMGFAAGLIIPITDSIESQISYEYRFDEINASNGDIEWTRFPLEAKIFYAQEKYRIGAGYTQHMNPKIEGSGVAAGRVEFKDASGYVIEANYRFNPQAYLGLKYTSIEYETNISTIKTDGNSIGLIIGYAFR